MKKINPITDMSEKLIFRNRDEFRKWLETNHDTHEAIWLVFGKGAKIKTLHPDEALNEALCFGWIDGLIKRVDDASYIKRFSHRNKSSQWSNRNKELVKVLITEGLMTEFGMEEIERAKKNSKWNVSERKPVTKEDIEIFISAINNAEPALSNYIMMSPSVQRTYAVHYLSAKREDTRKRRLIKIIDRLNKNLKPM